MEGLRVAEFAHPGRPWNTANWYQLIINYIFSYFFNF